MRLLWTDQALADLKHIRRFITQKSTQATEDKFIKKLIQKTTLLESSPNIGRMVPEYTLPSLREQIEGNYRVVYQVKSDHIYILTVFESHKLIDQEGIDSVLWEKAN